MDYLVYSIPVVSEEIARNFVNFFKAYDFITALTIKPLNEEVLVNSSIFENESLKHPVMFTTTQWVSVKHQYVVDISLKADDLKNQLVLEDLLSKKSRILTKDCTRYALIFEKKRYTLKIIPLS